jgi:hypothetical protein
VERLISEGLQQGDLVGVRIACADDEDQPDPWTLPPSRKRPDRPIQGPLPSSVEIVRANLVFIEKKALPPEMLNRLLRIAAFQNPEFYKAQAMRLSTFDKPRVIARGEDLARHVACLAVAWVKFLLLLKDTASKRSCATSALQVCRLTLSFTGLCGRPRRQR